MNADEEFILKVEAHQILYNKDSKSKKSQEQREKLWRQIAEQSHFENATAAQEKWQQLLLEYLEYLRRGAQFSNATAMKFMQPYMLHAIYDSDENSESDAELDDAALHRIINSDDESEAEQLQAKRFKTSKAKDTSKSENTTTTKNQKLNEITAVDPPESTKLNTTSNVPSETCSSANLSNFSSLELIFLGYAKVLQKMPLPLQLQTKRKISDIMDEAEMKLFELK